MKISYFSNGVRKESKFRSRASHYIQKFSERMRRIILSKEKLRFGLAITKIVELAQQESVSLFENDWEPIESEEVVKYRLTYFRVLPSDDTAHGVLRRHRHSPGAPLHVLIMHRGSKKTIFLLPTVAF